MPPVFMIALGAGIVSAIVFASATTGPLPMRIALFVITPLPLYLAGLGLGWRAAAIGATSGALLLAVLTQPLPALSFLICEAAPAIALTYLAGLSRDAGPLSAPGPQVEWYPTGRMLMWAALIGVALAVMTLGIVAGDRETMLQAMKAAAQGFIRKQLPDGAGVGPLDDAELTRIASIALQALPAMSAVTWTGGHLINLWLAGRVTQASGYLARPWPDLAATWLPPRLPLLLAAGLIGTLIADGPAQTVAAALTGGLVLAYMLQGLAVVHFITRGQPWRPFALWALYAAMILLNAVVPLLITMLGLADTLRPLRATLAAGRPPPPPSS